jgi:hypothetical protein
VIWSQLTAPFEEVVVLPVAVAVAFPGVVKVDRQNMAALLVEEQTCLLLILVVLLQVAKGDSLGQLVFKEEAITSILLIIPTAPSHVAELGIILALVLLALMVHTVLVLLVRVNQIT